MTAEEMMHLHRAARAAWAAHEAGKSDRLARRCAVCGRCGWRVRGIRTPVAGIGGAAGALVATVNQFAICTFQLEILNRFGRRLKNGHCKLQIEDLGVAAACGAIPNTTP